MATAPAHCRFLSRMHDGTGIRDHYFTVPLITRSPTAKN